MNDTTRQIGGALGVAVIGSVMSSIYGVEDRRLPRRHVRSAGSAASGHQGVARCRAGRRRAAVQTAPGLATALAHAANTAFVDGMHDRRARRRGSDPPRRGRRVAVAARPCPPGGRGHAGRRASPEHGDRSHAVSCAGAAPVPVDVGSARARGRSDVGGGLTMTATDGEARRPGTSPQRRGRRRDPRSGRRPLRRGWFRRAHRRGRRRARRTSARPRSTGVTRASVDLVIAAARSFALDDDERLPDTGTTARRSARARRRG